MTDPQLLTNTNLVGPGIASPDHDSVGIVEGRISAVGTRAQVERSLPDEHRVTDLGGRTLVPGFIDAHLHPMPLCFFEHHVDLSDVTSLEEVFDRLADRAASVGPEGWVVGLRLDDEMLRESRLPTRRELDQVGAGRPVLILRRDGHHAIGSTAALRAAGIDQHTPEPPGGVIHRDADGSLTGLCGEAASSMLLAAVPLPEWDEFGEALDLACARLARHGVTGISAMCQTSDEGPAGQAGALEAVAWSMLIDRVPFDVQTILIAANPATVAHHRDSPLHAPNRRRRLDAIKIFLDGTLGGHTACMHQPYADLFGGANTGMLTIEPDSAYRRMVAAHLDGLQICVHAIGDRANRTAADLYARLLDEHPVDRHRHRVEHASVLDRTTVECFAELGVAAVVQPISIASEQRWLHKRLGDERVGAVYPFRQLLDAGVTVAGSSDAPIETGDVLAAMHASVDRHGIAPEQAVTPTEAIAMYTQGAASVRQVDDQTGAIRPGALADLVVLSADPRAGFAGIEVLATLVAGRSIHRDDRLDEPA